MNAVGSIEAFLFIGGVSIVIIVALLVIGAIFSRLYRRASKEIAFVRTGFGGQKVVLSGGALVLPVLHEIIRVTMNTLRLEVRRANEQALITKDRMRVDVQAEFYVRVKPTEEAIADAAQTLGSRTNNPQLLKELIEGKFVDALRSVAASMNMEELHEQRVDFVQRVQAAVAEDLKKNGLELESVSLTSLDQTSQEHFNPQNAFDAQGLTKLTEQIEARRKERNEIERKTAVQIANQDYEAELQILKINRDAEYARLDQTREVEVRRAFQNAEIKKEQAGQRQVAEQSDIESKRQVDQTQILAQRSVEEERIRTEQAIEAAKIEKEKALKLAEQDRSIAIAAKSEAESQAQAVASKALAEAVQAEERVQTVRETEIAQRRKGIELVKAAEEAEREAIGVTVEAEAQKKAAMDRAEALRTEAEGEASATKTRALAAAEKYRVEAEGKMAMNEAENALSEGLQDMKLREALIESLPAIIAASTKPLENIDGIKIIDVSGLNSGHAGNGDGQSAAGGNSLADQVVQAGLRHRALAPLVDSLLKEAGLEGLGAEQITKFVGTTTPQKAQEPGKP